MLSKADDTDNTMRAFIAYQMEDYAAQQTAAKDAEAETFRCQLRDALKLRTNVMWFGTGLLTAASAVVKRAEAAERERDSLRAENAALKAGKDGQR